MNTRVRSCQGKLAYTRREARAQVRWRWAKFRGRYRAYRCDFADQLHPERPFHVGHLPHPGRRRRAR